MTCVSARLFFVHMHERAHAYVSNYVQFG